MGIQRYSLLVSVCIGLFLALNFYMYFFIYSTPEFKWVSFSYQVRNYLEAAALFFTIGFAVSVFFVMVIGGPLFWLAKKFSLVNIFTSAFGGAAVTVIPFVLCINIGWNIPSMATLPGLTALLVLAFCGATGGIVFYELESRKVLKRSVSN